MGVMTKVNDMEMPENLKKNKLYKAMGTIAISLIMIPCCLIVGFIVYVMTLALMETGGSTEGLALIVLLMSVFGIIFSMMVLYNVLFFSSDLDHLLPLPIKSSELVAAKFVTSYLAESVMEFMILFSGFVGYFIAAGVRIVPLLTAIAGVFLLPVLPLVYCGIFALVTMAFFTKIKIFRNVDVLTGIVTVVFLGFFAVSFFQMDAINIDNYIDGLLAGENIFINTMNKVFFTVPMFLKAISTGNALWLLAFVVTNVVAALILFALGDALYLKGVYLVSSMGRTGRKKKVDDAATYKKNDVAKTYFLKECRTLYRTPGYRKYCININIVWPFLVAALFFMPSTKEFMDNFTALFTRGYVATDLAALLFVIMIAFFTTAMNSIAATSFTREGNHFEFVKYTPIDYKLQIRVKSGVSILYSGATVIVSVIVLCAFMSVSPLTTVFFEVIAMCSVLICTYVGIMLDATHPKLNYEDEYGALRGNLNAFFNMAIAILIAMVLCALGFILFRFTTINTDFIYVIYFAIFLVVTWRLRHVCMVYTERCLREM